MAVATGPVARLMTINLYAVVNSFQVWCDNVVLSADVKYDLQFWARKLLKFNEQNI